MEMKDMTTAEIVKSIERLQAIQKRHPPSA
jgi:hypothetical protein